MKTYGFLTPEFWKETRFSKSPFQEYTDLLAKPTGKTLSLEEERVDAGFASFGFMDVLETLLFTFVGSVLYFWF